MASAAARAVGRHVEAITVALAAVGIFAVYARSHQYSVDLADEGYFLHLASRVHRGDLPYRDFDTYYTPGVFYLYAATFELFGTSILTVRDLLAGVRLACALLLYGLTRRVAPPPFAVLPFLAIAAIDATPVFPEPHPAWMGLLLTLATLEAITRHRASGRLRWVAAAGAAAGLAFLFKQNVGAFAALAVGSYLVLRSRGERRTGRLVLAIRASFAAGLGLVVTLLLWPALDPLLAGAIWLPALATLGLLLRWGWGGARSSDWWAGARPMLAECALAGAAFVGVTLLWLVPLTLALGPSDTPFGLFVGAVNQGALILPLEPPPRAARELALAAIWLPLVLALLGRSDAWRRRPAPSTSAATDASRRRWRTTLGAAAAMSLLVLAMPTYTGPREPLAEDPSFFPWLDRLDAELNTLYLYLPALGAWAGLAAVVLIARRRTDDARVAQPGEHDRRAGELVSWYLLVGTLAVLAMYPRSDTLHAMFAGPPLFVVGAWAMHRAHRALVGDAGWTFRAAVFAALLLVPVAAVAPHAYWRYVTIVHADPRSPTPPSYVPLGLDRAMVLAPEHVADNVRGAVELVRAGTPPGEPFFAYPAVPMFNFLADRPNPTRFDHFFPGAITARDMAEVIEHLEATAPRYAHWHHRGVLYSRTAPANPPLSDHIGRCYEQVANFPP